MDTHRNKSKETQDMKNTFKASISALTIATVVGTLAGWGALNSTKESGALAASNAITESNKATQSYEADIVHSNIVFKIRHNAVSNFYGRFNAFTGSIEFDKKNVENSAMTFTVDLDSVDTNNRTRDGHIKGADFFNARQYPEASFTSTKITADGHGKYTMTGDFTLQGKTVEIEALLHDIDSGTSRSGEVMGFEAVFSIKRSEFGITKYYDEANPEKGPLGDLVELTVAIEAVAK